MRTNALRRSAGPVRRPHTRRARKERTLQVRVPEDVFQAVKASAAERERTVSDEVRALLASHYEIRPPLPAILGWQPFTLAVPAACEGCGAARQAGDAMFVGITREDPMRLVVCAECRAPAELKGSTLDATNG